MSVVLAVALVTTNDDKAKLDVLNDHLDIPDFVKQNLDKNLLPYLRAIQLDGYENYRKRKMMIVGNTGKYFLILKILVATKLSVTLQLTFL